MQIFLSYDVFSYQFVYAHVSCMHKYNTYTECNSVYEFDMLVRIFLFKSDTLYFFYELE